MNGKKKKRANVWSVKEEQVAAALAVQEDHPRRRRRPARKSNHPTLLIKKLLGIRNKSSRVQNVNF